MSKSHSSLKRKIDFFQPIKEKIVKYTKPENKVEIVFSCFDVNIKIELPNSKYLKDLKFWLERFCPGVNVGKSDEYDCRIKCLNKDSDKYKVASQSLIILYSKWNYDYSAFLAKFITQVFQKFLNAKHLYIVPAACAVYGSKAILFIGDFWQGKTSCVLSLYRKDNNIKIISDNYVILKDNNVLCGTKYISLREENLFRYMDLVSTKISKSINSRKFFKFKETKKIAEVVGFIIPYINSDDNSFYVLSNEEATWYLYQKFSRIISGETILFNGNIPSPSLDNIRLSINRLNYIKNILKDNLYYVSTSVGKISNYALDILKGESKI